MSVLTFLFLFVNVFDVSRSFKLQKFSYKINFLLLALIVLVLCIFYGVSVLTNVIASITVLLYLGIIVFIPRHYFYGAALFMLFLALIFIIFALGKLAEFCGNFAFVLLASGFIHDLVWPFLVNEKENDDGQ